MNANFVYLKDFVFRLELDSGFDKNQIIEDFKNEDFGSDTIDAYGTTGFSSRRNIKEIKSSRLKSISDYFSSDLFKKLMIDTLYSQPNFGGQWAISPKRMFDMTAAITNLTCDSPGHNTGIHIDNRCIVATGMCYFSPEDDPDISTWFFDTKDKKNPLRILTDFSSGWLAANMHDSWHDGYNKSNYNRYTLMYGLVLKYGNSIAIMEN
jgi:hypothetical protein